MRPSHLPHFYCCQLHPTTLADCKRLQQRATASELANRVVTNTAVWRSRPQLLLLSKFQPAPVFAAVNAMTAARRPRVSQALSKTAHKPAATLPLGDASNRACIAQPAAATRAKKGPRRAEKHVATPPQGPTAEASCGSTGPFPSLSLAEYAQNSQLHSYQSFCVVCCHAGCSD